MQKVILLHKPYGVLSQFTDAAGRPTLSDWLKAPGYRPAGRLDADSEGLLVLTSAGALQTAITAPGRGKFKTYWVQVEGVPSSDALERLRRGVVLADGPTLPARVETMDPPVLPDRVPPIRHRLTVPTAWLRLSLEEGRNRQVRRMTAAVGLPTLRLVRWAVGPWTLEGLAAGEHRWADASEFRYNPRGRRTTGPAKGDRP